MGTGFEHGAMMGWGGGWGFGFGLLHWLFLLFLLGLVVWLVVSVVRGGRRPSPHETALAEAAGRYARGEIDQEEYLRIRKDLG